jgi:hypothetical protein
LGAEQRAAFENIKEYLRNPLVLQAPVVDKEFLLYIIAHACIVGAMLFQEKDKKEFPVTYIS